MSSFFYNPMFFNEQQQPILGVSNIYPNQVQFGYQHVPHLLSQKEQVRKFPIQFKIFVYEKFNRSDLKSASAIYRFDFSPNQSFDSFLKVLNEHDVRPQTHKFYYLDDEQDWVLLSTDYDFKYMMKIMNGKTVKIACETISQKSPLVQEKGQSKFYRNLPFFMHPVFGKRQEQSTRRGCSIDHATRMRISDLRSNVETSKNDCQDQQKYKTTCEEILEFIRKKREQQKEEQEDSIEMSIAPQQNQEITTPLVEEKKEEPTIVAEFQDTIEEKKEETPVEEEKPILSTSQIVSNYLLEEEQDIVTDEEDNQSEVQYHVFETEEPSSQPIALSEPQLPQQQFELELKLLSEMGFNDTHENLRLLTKHNNDIQRTISELLNY